MGVEAEAVDVEVEVLPTLGADTVEEEATTPKTSIMSMKSFPSSTLPLCQLSRKTFIKSQKRVEHCQSLTFLPFAVKTQ